MISIINPIESIEQVGCGGCGGGGGGGGITSGVLSLSVNGGPQQVGNVSITIPTTAGDILAAPVDHNHDDRYYTNSGSQGLFVSKTGNENIDGVKNFTLRPTVTGTEVVVKTDFNYISIDSLGIVFTTGNQIISGIKDFDVRPTVNGTPILLSGEVSGGGSTGSAVSRGTASVTTTSIAASGTFNTTVDFGCKSYGLLSVSGASGAWVKLYYDTTSRTNDATRTIDQDPSSNVYLMAESVSTTNGVIRFAPATIGYNEGTNNSIPIAITNTRTASATYTIEFNFLKL